MRSTFAICLLVAAGTSSLPAADSSPAAATPAISSPIQQQGSGPPNQALRSVVVSPRNAARLPKQMLIVNPAFGHAATTGYSTSLRQPASIASLPSTTAVDTRKRGMIDKKPAEINFNAPARSPIQSPGRATNQNYEPAFSRKPKSVVVRRNADTANRTQTAPKTKATAPDADDAIRTSHPEDSSTKSSIPTPPKTDIGSRRINVAPSDSLSKDRNVDSVPAAELAAPPVGSGLRESTEADDVATGLNSIFIPEPIIADEMMETLIESGTAPLGDPSTLSSELTFLPVESFTNPNDAPSQQNIQFESDVPQLRVSTVGPNTLVVGKSANYAITLINRSNFDARDVRVRCSIPAWVDLDGHDATVGNVVTEQREVVWIVEHVPARGEQGLNLQLIPRAGRAFDLHVDISVQPSETRKRITIQEPKLTLDMTGPDDVVYGQPNTWKVTLANPGTGDANDVALNVYSGSRMLETQRLGTIPAGGRRNATLEINAQGTGRHGLRLVASGSPSLQDEFADEFICRRGELEISITGSDFEYAGTDSKYHVSLTNVGDAPAHNVLLNLTLPDGVEYVSGLDSPTLIAGGVSWVVKRLDMQATLDQTLVLRLIDGGEHNLSLYATSTEDLEATSSVVTSALTSADLKLLVTDPVGPQPKGSTVDYQIEVVNQGTDTARQIEVIGVCAPELEPSDVEGNAHIKGGHIYFKPIPELPAEHKVTFTVRARASKPGTHAFRVIVKSYQPDLRLAVEESTLFFERNRAEPFVEPLLTQPVEETARLRTLPRSKKPGSIARPPFSPKPESQEGRRRRVVKPEMIDLETEEMASRQRDAKR